VLRVRLRDRLLLLLCRLDSLCLSRSVLSCVTGEALRPLCCRGDGLWLLWELYVPEWLLRLRIREHHVSNRKSKSVLNISLVYRYKISLNEVKLHVVTYCRCGERDWERDRERDRLWFLPFWNTFLSSFFMLLYKRNINCKQYSIVHQNRGRQQCCFC